MIPPPMGIKKSGLGGRWARHWIDLALGGMFAFSTLGASASEPPQLALGSTVERFGSPESVYSFRLPTPDRGLLRIEVEQAGTDVELLFFDTGRSLPLEIDQPDDRHGPERLVLDAEELESPRLDVRFKTNGCFRLLVEALEPEPGSPRRQLAAERFSSLAASLAREGGIAPPTQALQQYRKALDLWEAEGEDLEVARTKHHLAATLLRAGDRQGALPWAQEALDLWNQLGSTLEKAASLHLTGHLHWVDGDFAPAEQAYLQALALRREKGRPCEVAQTLNNLGTLALGQGDVQAARPYFLEGAELCSPEEEPRTHAALLAGLGGVHWRLGELLQALDRTHEAVPFLEGLGRHRDAAQVLSNLGVYSRHLGESQRALDYYRRALTTLDRLGDLRSAARARNGLAQVYLQLGDPEASLAYLQRALVMRREVGDRRGEAVTLNSLGRAHLLLGNSQKALEFALEALDLHRQLGRRNGEAGSLELLGLVYQHLGQWSLAESALASSFEAQTELGNISRQATSLSHLGRTQLMAGHLEEAVETLGRSLVLHRQARRWVSEVSTLGDLARAEIRTGDLDRAGHHLNEAKGRLESLRLEILDPGLRSSFAATQRSIDEGQVILAMEQHTMAPGQRRDHAALALSERSRARGFLERLDEVEAKRWRNLDPDLARRRRVLQRELNEAAVRLRRQLARDPDEQGVGSLEETLERRLDALGQLEETIRRRHAADPRQDWQPLAPREMQALLEPGTLLLHYLLGEDRSFLWAIDRRTIQGFELPPRLEIEDLARRLQNAWSTLDPRSRRADNDLAHELSAKILSPASELFDGIERLVVVADGALQFIPFAGLPSPRSPAEETQPLIAEMEVARLPSATVLSRLRRRGPSQATGMAILADPIFQRGDPRVASSPIPRPSGPGFAPAGLRAGDEAERFERLPGSRQEAQAIANLVGDPRPLVLLDGAARKEWILEHRLRNHRWLHFATHGLLDSRRPRLSGLALAQFDEAGTALGGFLAAHEIYDLELDADLVVLSGCQTALGKEIRGEGLVGLARGFLYAGARRVVASLWRVQDRATVELMERFYHQILVQGSSPAAALRQAQLEMLQDRRFQDPYFWAAFVHIGDWA